jgi:hypothetical protein
MTNSDGTLWRFHARSEDGYKYIAPGHGQSAGHRDGLPTSSDDIIPERWAGHIHNTGDWNTSSIDWLSCRDLIEDDRNADAVSSGSYGSGDGNGVDADDSDESSLFVGSFSSEDEDGSDS